MTATKMKLGDSKGQNVLARIKIVLLFAGEHLGAVGYAIVLRNDSIWA